ncbi:ArnT family glycosyltransferase [Mycolicibacterium arenosum]|uniref:ABC transporter n=1 Tax=Mycolicibacterium arenosum TaxID=2952157 RepID=A0ABT1M4J8_9MYCO|nr:ABC transporter [Mycolicibacterium sp. CAU 1645]MCP9274081.1 ABC transporter [Mycolicibacterium sp. CAU 1645]
MTEKLRVSDRRLKFAVFLVALAVYLAVGYWLQVRHGFILGDALSRVSAAQSALFSRDPHLAAIGFIFTPLTAMVQIPAVLLSPLWPEMTERAFSGTIMSAVFMAGGVVQILGMGTDRGLPRGYVLAITALFAFNPMIVFYGSNGMSEAPFIFFMSWAVRRLIMWMVDDDVHHLVAAGGIAMGLAYLTRYDAVACVAAAGLLVGATTYLRAKPEPRFRRALLDTLLVSGPGFAAFVGWAAASWLITGEAFAQFTSQYGNAAILAQSGQPTETFTAGMTFALVCITFLAPTLAPLALCCGIRRYGRPNWSVLLVPLFVYGAALAFQTFSYATGSTFPFLRFYIVAIPLSACLAMLAVPDGVLIPATRRGRYAPPQPDPGQEPRRRSVVYPLVAALFAVAVPVTAWAMGQPRYAPQEYALGAVLAPDPDDVSVRKATEHSIAASFGTERQIARYLEGLNLPESSVITDTVYGFAVTAASSQPETFVVPSDSDFVALLNDPENNGVEYLLAVPPTGRGISDALNVRYPTLYETGADIATLELEIPNDGDSQPTWRLYRVNEPMAPR